MHYYSWWSILQVFDQIECYYTCLRTYLSFIKLIEPILKLPLHCYKCIATIVAITDAIADIAAISHHIAYSQHYIYLRMCSHDVSIVAFQGWHMCLLLHSIQGGKGVARPNAQCGSTSPTARISLQFPSPGIVRQPPTVVYVNYCVLCWFQRRGSYTEDPWQI